MLPFSFLAVSGLFWRKRVLQSVGGGDLVGGDVVRSVMWEQVKKLVVSSMLFGWEEGNEPEREREEKEVCAAHSHQCPA